MSCGLSIDNVTLNRVTTKELQDTLEECTENIEDDKLKIHMLAAATPRQIKNVDGDIIEWEDHVSFEIKNILEAFEEDIIKRFLTQIAIHNPEDVKEF